MNTANEDERLKGEATPQLPLQNSFSFLPFFFLVLLVWSGLLFGFSFKFSFVLGGRFQEGRADMGRRGDEQDWDA